MKTGTILLASAIVLAACDRGTAPGCADSDSTCATTAIGGSTSSSGSGNNGGNNGGDGDSDGTGEPSGETPSSAFWEPAWDTGTAVKTLFSSSLAGFPNVPGGQARGLVFYLVDSTLHMVASSDADKLDTYNRKTIFDVKVQSSDTLMFKWNSPSDQNLASVATTAWQVIDPTTIEHVVVAKMTTLARPLESSITTRKGATLKIWVKVRSGSLLDDEDALPRLDIASTRPLLFAGGSLKSIGSDPFLVEIP